MRPERVRQLLVEVSEGRCSPAEAERILAWQPFEELEFARIDHHRALRNGYPEEIFGAGKTADQIVAIAEHIAARGDGFLATRVAADAAERLLTRFEDLEYSALGRAAFLPAADRVARPTRGSVLIVAAGTSDLPVAEEAAITARAFGNPVEQLNDVGVAGLHRLLAEGQVLTGAAVLIVVAGMEGALPSVVGGLVRAPVIAVPTSIGYGAAFGGLAALLGMLNSCASGVTVVNIDNGFGAACAASRINLVLS